MIVENRRPIGFIGVALIKGKLRQTGKALISTRDAVEAFIIKQLHFFDDAPFKWVGLAYRYGTRNHLKPYYQKINQKYGDIPVAIELNMEVLQAADRISLDLLRDIFTVGALECLIDIGRKYKLPTDIFVAERIKYNDIPETAEEVEALPNHRLVKEEYLS